VAKKFVTVGRHIQNNEELVALLRKGLTQNGEQG
jgi:hypothetical protein